MISANLAHGDLGSAVAALDGIVQQVELPVGTTAFLSGQSEEMTASFKSLQFVLVLAIFLVYLVMASQFESLIHPFVILLTIPLALIGAVWALWLTGTTVNVVAYIGLIMLAGIVVNQSIVLIDAVNQLRAEGMPKLEAIVEGGKLRLRPILITKLTTILGLLPMALGIGEGAEVRAPMAITVIGGVLLTTFLTLLVIPVVYSVMDRKQFVATEPLTDARDPPLPKPPRAEDAAMLHTEVALARPVTTVMAALALLAVGLISGKLLRLEAMPDISFPGMQIVVPYAGSTPGGDGGTGGAPGRGGARHAVGHRGDPRQRAVRPGDLHGAVRLGPRRRRRRVRRAHQARLDPAAAAGGRRPAADVRVQLRRPARRRDPHRVRQGPDRPVRDAGEVPAAPDGADRGRRARRTAGRRAARSPHPGRPHPARRLQRRRARAAQAARAKPTSRSAPARSRRTTRASPCARSASSAASTTCATCCSRPERAARRTSRRSRWSSPELTVGRRMDGKPAVGIDVFKATQANVVDVADRVIEAIEKARELPQFQGIQILVVGNQADSIRSSLSELRKAGMIGAVLSFFMLLFFLRHLPTTLIVSLAVPASLLVTLAAMYFLGFTLNILTMMGMLLAIGMLVDNSVVITESIFRHRQLHPGKPLESTLAGVKEVGVATLAGTFSMIIVFLPLVFGERNQMSIFLVHVAVPIIVAMLASLVIAQTLLPMLAARMSPPPPVQDGSWFGRLQDRYEKRAQLGADAPQVDGADHAADRALAGAAVRAQADQGGSVPAGSEPRPDDQLPPRGLAPDGARRAGGAARRGLHRREQGTVSTSTPTTRTG